jgi:hypothetical protein
MTLGRLKYIHLIHTYIHLIHTYLIAASTSSEVEAAIKYFKRHKSQGTDQILAELIQTGRNALCREFHIIINFIWNYKKLPQQ